MGEANEEGEIRISFTTLATSLLYAMFLSSGSASGFIVQLDGWARAGVVYGSPEIVICCKSVSGSERTELFALDPKTKSVAWRRKSAWSISDAMLDNQGNYISIEDPSNLTARQLKTGSVVWDANLAAIKPSETAWIEESLHRRDFGVGCFDYKGPFITSDGVWVFRVYSNYFCWGWEIKPQLVSQHTFLEFCMICRNDLCPSKVLSE